MNGTIVLPWPPKALHPNSRPHWGERSRAAKAYREQAYWITRSAQIDLIEAVPADGEIMLDVRFYPPSNRGDTDGMFSACKSAFDGIADAIMVNDRRFAFTIRRLEPSKNGAVFVDVREAA